MATLQACNCLAPASQLGVAHGVYCLSRHFKLLASGSRRMVRCHSLDSGPSDCQACCACSLTVQRQLIALRFCCLLAQQTAQPCCAGTCRQQLPSQAHITNVVPLAGPTNTAPMLCRYLQAAAALVLYPDCSAQHQLMALLCRVPAQFLTPAMMRLATAAWHWICAAQPRLQVSQVLLDG